MDLSLQFPNKMQKIMCKVKNLPSSRENLPPCWGKKGQNSWRILRVRVLLRRLWRFWTAKESSSTKKSLNKKKTRIPNPQSCSVIAEDMVNINLLAAFHSVSQVNIKIILDFNFIGPTNSRGSRVFHEIE